MSLHRGSGQAMVRFVEHREGDDRGPVKDVYLGVYGSAGVPERYEEVIREWIQRSLQVGWSPAGWQPAQTGHEGVLTVGGLVEGYRRRLDGVWGEDWQEEQADPDQAREYRGSLERARESKRRGRWDRDREMIREGKKMALEARLRHGHLDATLERLWTKRVLGDLTDEFGPMAAAAFGDRELRQLRKNWDTRDCSLSERKAGMRVVQDAWFFVIGREAKAPWDLDRSYLERNTDRYGLDLGVVGADGRWVRIGK